MKRIKIANGLLIVFLGLAVSLVACKKEGCTDPLATNYNSKANHDDGTCNYDGVTPGTVLEITENVEVPTTWAASTVKVCGNIYVNAALTVNPGVTVIMCATSSLEIMETGSINAVGNAGAPIIFKGEVATKGYWAGIHIRSNNPNNQFNFVTVSDAGSYWAWEYANVSLAGSAKLSLSNSTISNSERYGLFANESAVFPTFSNNTFSNNAQAGLNISIRQAGSIDAGSNYNSGNGEEFIYARGGTISTVTTWPYTTTPLLIDGTVNIEAGLTITPGATILMESDAVLEIKESGFISAVGTAGSPITIRGRYASAGYWEAIYIRSNNPNNKLNYVNIMDGGAYWAHEFSSVYVSGRLEMNNSSISNSNSWAVYIKSSASIYCSGVSQTDPSGVTAVNSLTGNGTGADADCVGGGCTVIFE